jgi:glycosyltransferase involved in cell wall biosynthesis
MINTVAIVLPFRNAGAYIQKTLAGIRSQIHTEWTLYAVDDGSTDMSDTIIRQSIPAEKLVMLSSSARNPAGTRNVALEAIRNAGDAYRFVAYCDADDVWEVDHLSLAIQNMMTTHSDMTYSDVKVVLEDGTPVVMTGIPYHIIFDKAKLTEQNFIFISTVVHFSSILSVIDLRNGFDESAVPMEDWDFWQRIASFYRISHNPVITCTYLYKDKTGSYYTAEQSQAAKTRIDSKNKVMKEFNTLEGWLSEDEGQFLKITATDKVCMEIGSYKGKSSSYIASSAKSLHCIDTFQAEGDGQTQRGVSTTLDDFKKNTARFDNITPIIGKSGDVVHLFVADQFDMMFIDGMHDFDSVSADILSYWDKLKVGGDMMFHDYDQKNWPGVVSAIQKYFGFPDQVVDTVARVRKRGQDLPQQPELSFGGRYKGKIVMIAPFSNKLPTGENPKNFPYWPEMVSLMRAAGIYTIQVGIAGEKSIDADEMLFNPSNETLKKFVLGSDSFVSVDTFFQHFAAFHKKRGVVIFSQSDPNIFGHSLHVNILKSREYLRDNQFNLWTQATYNKDTFPTAYQVFMELLNLLNPE